MIRISRDGHFYLFYNGPPRRDFILRAEIRLSWGGNCYVLARARYDGFFYAFGLELNQDYDDDKQKARNRKPVVAAFRRENWKVTKWLDDQGPPRDFELDDDKWYRVEVECRGSRQTFRVNGKTVFTFNDQALKQGTVGFACCGGSGNTYVDIRNVEIRELRDFSDALARIPHSPSQLYELAQGYESAGKSDLAIGNYRAAMLFLGRNKLDSKQRRILFGARTRLKRIDRDGAALANLKKRLVRDLEKLAGRLTKKKKLMLASETHALLSNLVPENHEYAEAFYHYHALCAARQSLGKFERTPKGYRSLFNHVDLAGWECRYGNWRVIKGILTCKGWGMLDLPGRYHDYRLRMRYRAGLPREKNAESHRIYIHQDTRPGCEWIRAELLLVGPDAGMVTGITPLTRYTTGNDEDMHMAKPFRFREMEWIDLDLTVKERWIKVKLNNKLVFESNKYSQIENYDDEHKRDFPGRLCLCGDGSKLEISSIFFKPGRKAR